MVAAVATQAAAAVDEGAFEQRAAGDHVTSHRIRGFCDTRNSRILLTSVFEDCYPEDLRYKVPVHELTHLVYSPGIVWLREGIANCEAGMLTVVDLADLPEGASDLWFCRDGDEPYKTLGFEGEVAFFSAWGKYMQRAGPAPTARPAPNCVPRWPRPSSPGSDRASRSAPRKR